MEVEGGEGEESGGAHSITLGPDAVPGTEIRRCGEQERSGGTWSSVSRAWRASLPFTQQEGSSTTIRGLRSQDKPLPPKCERWRGRDTQLGSRDIGGANLPGTYTPCDTVAFNNNKKITTHTKREKREPEETEQAEALDFIEAERLE